MITKAIKTARIDPNQPIPLLQTIETALTSLKEKSVVVVTSKIIAITQGRVIKKSVDKNELIEKEADLFIPPDKTNHDFYLTIKNNILIPNAGIDQSNASDYYILWPDNPGFFPPNE